MQNENILTDHGPHDCLTHEGIPVSWLTIPGRWKSRNHNGNPESSLLTNIFCLSHSSTTNNNHNNNGNNSNTFNLLFIYYTKNIQYFKKEATAIERRLMSGFVPVTFSFEHHDVKRLITAVKGLSVSLTYSPNHFYIFISKYIVPNHVKREANTLVLVWRYAQTATDCSTTTRWWKVCTETIVNRPFFLPCQRFTVDWKIKWSGW